MVSKNSLKIINQRNEGSLFHYAHFLCDCVFVEVLNGIDQYSEVIRQKTIDQTLGNFAKIYTEITGVKNIELKPKDFAKLAQEPIKFNKKENYLHEEFIETFRDFIFKRLNIRSQSVDPRHPEILLIKRYSRVELIDDEELKAQNKNVTTGKERRCIHDVDRIENHMRCIFGSRFLAVYNELIPFRDQVCYYKNARLIVCAHGASMSNLFFCEKDTVVIEVTCDMNYEFFNRIAGLRRLNHVKCCVNRFDAVLSCIEDCVAYMNKNHRV